MPSIRHVRAPRNYPQLLAIVVAAASLAACARTSVVSERSEWRSAPRQAVAHHRPRPVSVVRRHDAPARTDVASGGGGLASFYTEGAKTANGDDANCKTLAES